MIAFLLTPLGRYVVIAAAIIVAVAGVYVKIRADAVSQVEAKATTDALKRVQDAIAAGDAAAVAPDRLLDDDGHRRD